ncbi:hypothetical protein PFISCL1PPCAC_4874, partial [Pristionchus fissidentatus]
ALLCIVMVQSVVLMTYGYQTQVVCEPYFYDDSLKVLDELDGMEGFLYRIASLNGSMARVDFSEIMQQCSKDASFISAVGSYSILRVSNIFRTGQLENAFANAIVNFQIVPLSAKELQNLTNALDALDEINLTPPLDKAQKADPEDFVDIATQMTELSASLKAAIAQCKSVATKAEALADGTQINKLLGASGSEF